MKLDDLSELLKTAAASIGNKFQAEAKVTILIRLPEHRTPNDSDILVSNDEIEDIIISLKSLATRERELS